MQKVKTRYAPSPTGVPHVGNIRTALLNYLFAKNQGGEFILRIEDTDQTRSTKEHIKDIELSLKLLNLNWDKDYLQSERLDIYQKHLEILKKKGVAYRDSGAWRFKIENPNAIISWEDLVHKKVQFPVNVLEDFVIVKSDGFPTYHFASVVDDHEMNITHVMRGDEWISSTPKHLLLYESFGWQPPQFAHLPSILGSDGKKLSKREGAKSIGEYLEEGYLAEALTNFLALLGWSPKGNRELFSLRELIDEFSVERINKNSPIFNIKKLNWFNRKYLQNLTDKDFAEKIIQNSKNAEKLDKEKLTAIIELIKERLTTLRDFDSYSEIFFKKGKQNPPEKSKVEMAQNAVRSVPDWKIESITKSLNEFAQKNKIDPAEFKNTLRLAVFADNTPPIYESLAILERGEVEERLSDVLKQ